MDQSLQIQPHVRLMVDSDGGVLLDLRGGKYYSLNAVGTQIMKKIDEKASHLEILRHLESMFQVPRERLQADLVGFVQSLKQKGLIDVIP